MLRLLKGLMDIAILNFFMCVLWERFGWVYQLYDSYVSLQATFDCLLKTYGYLTPDFWRETRYTKSPFQEHTDLLAKPTKAIYQDDAERVEA